MVLRSSRTLIRAWQRHDDDLVAEWPPYYDPLEPLWNLPRQNSNDWYSGFDFGSSRRTWAVEDLSGHLMGRISLREVDEKIGGPGSASRLALHMSGKGSARKRSQPSSIITSPAWLCRHGARRGRAERARRPFLRAPGLSACRHRLARHHQRL